MIVLPAIPAIVAALTPIVQAAAVAAGIGAVLGAGTGAVSCGISGVREHGEINRTVFVNSAQCAGKSAAEGALVGGVMAPAGLLIAPVVAPVIGPVISPAINVVDDVAGAAIQVIDDAAKPLIEVVDDVAKSTVGSIDDAGVVAGSAVIADDAASPFLRRARLKFHAVDDAVRPVMNKFGNAAKKVARGVSAPVRLARSFRHARNYKTLPKGSGNKGYVYVMDDVTTPGRYKIGKTIDPPTRLKKVQSNLNTKTTSGGKVQYKCIISTKDMKSLEDALLEQFKPQNLPNFDAGTEWFTLTAVQVAAACSH